MYGQQVASHLVNDFIRAMNRAAEAAVPIAINVFVRTMAPLYFCFSLCFARS